MIVIIKTVDINNVTIITDANFGNIPINTKKVGFVYILPYTFINS